MKLTRRSALAALAAPAILRPAPKSFAFALIGDRYHNSDYIRTGLTRTIARDLDISIDFCDETKMLTAETLQGYKLLVILRDGMIWPDGYPDENTNAAWVATGKPALVSDPPVPKTAPNRHSGSNRDRARRFGTGSTPAGPHSSCITSRTSGSPIPTSVA